MCSWLYRAYGLCIASNRQLPGLLSLPTGTVPVERIDLQVCFETLPDWLADILRARQTLRYVSPYLDENGHAALLVWLTADGAFYRFHYTEGIDYVLSSDGARLWVCASSTVAERDILSYLLGPVTGFVLRVRGVVCLHASAIAVDGRAIVFVGDIGAGKSTTAMAMGRLGYPIISDDIVPIRRSNGATLAEPGYPRMRLRQAALPMLSNINPDLPPLPKPEGDGRLHFALTGDGYRFQSEPLPIGALYLLGDRDRQAARVEPVLPVEGFIHLVGNTYVTRFLDTSMRAHEFHELSQLVQAIPVRKLHPHPEPSHLITSCKAILEDFRTGSR